MSKFDPLRVGVELSSDVLEKMTNSKYKDSSEICPCCRKLTSNNIYNAEKETSLLKTNNSSSGFIRKIHHSIRRKNPLNELTIVTKVINLTFSNGQSLGLSVRTRKFNRRQEAALILKNKNFNLKHGVFISKVRPGSLSSKDSNIRVGDQVVCINGADVTGYSVKKVAGLMFMMKEDLQITLRSFIFSQSQQQNDSVVEEHKKCTCSNHKQKFGGVKKLATLHENDSTAVEVSEVEPSVNLNENSKENNNLQESVTLAKPGIGKRRNGSLNVGPSVTASVYDNGTPLQGSNSFFDKSPSAQQFTPEKSAEIFRQDPVHQKFDESLLLLQNAILGLPGFSPPPELDCSKQADKDVSLSNNFLYIDNNSSTTNEIPETNLSDVDSLLSEFLENSAKQSVGESAENHVSKPNSFSVFEKEANTNREPKKVLFDEPDYDDVASSETEDAFDVDEIDIDELVGTPAANKNKKRKKVVRSKSFAVSGAFSNENQHPGLVSKRTAPGLFPLISCNDSDSENNDHSGCKKTVFSSKLGQKNSTNLESSFVQVSD